MNACKICRVKIYIIYFYKNAFDLDKFNQKLFNE